MCENSISVYYNTSIFNARPWHVGIRHMASGAIDETLGEYAHPVDAMRAAFAAQMERGLPVQMPRHIAERFVMPFQVQEVAL